MLPGQLERLEVKVQSDHKVHLAVTEQKEIREIPVRKDPQEQLVQQVRKEALEPLVLVDQRDQRERLEVKAR